MDIRKIALGLLFGGALAAGSVACDDSSSSSSSSSGADGGVLPMPCATIATDPDTATTPFVTITHLTLPQADGFNLDAINNAPRGGTGGGKGATVDGCGKADIAGGLDNALAGIATSLASIIDLNAALQAALQPSGGTLLIEAQMTHLSAADVANDSCIGATIRVTATGSPAVMFDGSGSMTNHVASVAFANELMFNVAVMVPSNSCINNTCTPGDLGISVRSPIARVTLNATNTVMQPGSLIGGYVFFEDTSSAAYDAANLTGFHAALNEYASQISLAPSFLDQAVTAFSGARDLHMEATGVLSPCTSPTNSTSNTNRNSVSIGLGVDSM